METLLEIPGLMPGQLPGDMRVEFFRLGEDDVYCFHNGATLIYQNFTKEIFRKVKDHINDNPEIVAKVVKMPGDFGGDFIKKYIYHAFGRLSKTPDIDRDGSMNEELNVRLNNGEPLSEREVEVAGLCHLPDKLISDKLFISTHTINTHFQTIRHKSGLSSKPEMALASNNEGILQLT